MKEKIYRFTYNGDSWRVYGNNKEDAIFLFYCQYGYPEDFIKKHFKIERIYE